MKIHGKTKKAKKKATKVKVDNRKCIFNEHDSVMLLQDIKIEGPNGFEIYKRGTDGTVVSIYNSANVAVEFDRADVQNVAVRCLGLRKSIRDMQPPKPKLRKPSYPRPPAPAPIKLPLTRDKVSAMELLTAEHTRLTIMAKAMKDDKAAMIKSMAWAFQLASDYLGSLNAPERIKQWEEVKPKSIPQFPGAKPRKYVRGGI